jgi:Na+/serine symporter
MEDRDTFWNPYLAGIALGLVLLTTFLVMGRGLGASGAAYRIGARALEAVAPAHAAANASLAQLHEGSRSVLDDWLVFELLGVFLGGALGAVTAGRFGAKVIRNAVTSVSRRLAFAFGGGVLMGLAARAARGCTSGQALSGGAVLSVGSWIFMLSVFAGGYAFAWFVRRQWQ